VIITVQNVLERIILLEKPKNENRLYKREMLFFVPEMCRFYTKTFFSKIKKKDKKGCFRSFKHIKREGID